MIGSGVAELAAAALLAAPRGRTAGAWCAAAILVGVFPGNVTHALRAGPPSRSRPLGRATLAWLRLPLQAPLVWWALRLARCRDAAAR